MEKVTKKYKCSIYKGGVWWSANSIDKPSKNLFITNYKNKMVDIDITPNWIDQFTVNLVLDKPSYGLLKIEDLTLNKTFYFINSNINKALTNGYLVTYDLDLYLTYGLTFFEEIRKQGFNTIKVNRMLYPLLFRKQKIPSDISKQYYPSDKIDYFWKYHYQLDPLINFEKYGYTSYMKEANIQLTKFRLANFLHTGGMRMAQESTDTNNKFDGINPIFIGDNSYQSKPVVHMFQFSTGVYIGFLQVATDGWATLKMPNWCGSTEKDSISSSLDPSGNIRLKVIKNFAWKFMNEISWMANKYVGCFEIPFIEYITDWFLWNGKYSKKGDVPTNLGDYYNVFGETGHMILGFSINREEFIRLYRPKQNASNVGVIGFSSTISIFGTDQIRLNNNFLANFLINYANPYNFTFRPFVGGGHYPLDFWSNANLTFDGNNFNIVQNHVTEFNSSSTMENLYKNMINGGNGINTMRGTFNVNVDSYNEYINSVKIQQNTNLEIARQSIGFSTTSNLLNFAATGELSGINMVNQGLQAVGGLMKYANMEKSYAAQNMTAKNTAKSENISSSVTADDTYNKMNFKGSKPVTRVYVNIPLKFPQTLIEQYEITDFILKYGIYINDSFPVDLFFSFIERENNWENNFIYIDFEITERLLKMVFPNENQELIDALKILCQNSFRIWKIDNIKFEIDEIYNVF